MTDWRPIETAPKDGTTILSWDGSHYICVAWSTRDRCWFVDDGVVTHWMPLPLPPGCAGSGTEGERG